MKTIRVKDLRRSQVEKLLKVNHPHVVFNKRSKLKSLRDKLNILGGDFAHITFNEKFEIKLK